MTDDTFDIGIYTTEKVIIHKMTWLSSGKGMVWWKLNAQFKRPPRCIMVAFKGKWRGFFNVHHQERFKNGKCKLLLDDFMPLSTYLTSIAGKRTPFQGFTYKVPFEKLKPVKEA